MSSPTGFFRRAEDLVCDDVPLAEIAAAVGTPLYVYSAAALRGRYRAIDEAFGGYPHAVHYALKANSTLAIARLLRRHGAAADANSAWEIDVARRAGFAPTDIVFTGVGKSPSELECAVSLGVKAINVESAGELARVEEIASRLGRTARVAVRINPDIDARSHPRISTGLKVNKFGMPLDEAGDLFDRLPDRRALKLVAVHVHIGSQITSLDPLQRAAALAAAAAGDLAGRRVALEYLDLGGGLAGRAIAAPAGVVVARVVDLKSRDADSDFAVIYAGMTELLRPAMYDAFHRIEPVTLRRSNTRRYEIVGPVCESSDVVGRDRELPRLKVGDFVAILDAGAYGSAMASNYNRRPLPPEVLVDSGAWRIIRRRQTTDDMLSLETDD
ncbi:MAG: diaminopimelate decarboxylase [Acidobacteria bacterium]|nr:MAG: diaminopimelate decarboxylase [Acidobacteriota bacterium]